MVTFLDCSSSTAEDGHDIPEMAGMNMSLITTLTQSKHTKLFVVGEEAKSRRYYQE